jgi:hypothetical protein
MLYRKRIYHFQRIWLEAGLVSWFLLAGNDPDELRKAFAVFYSARGFPRGVALWKWKRTCWICSPRTVKDDILAAFVRFGAVEFSSAPSPADLEFLHGDAKALTVPS